MWIFLERFQNLDLITNWDTIGTEHFHEIKQLLITKKRNNVNTN